jgi:hypothetical protein
MKIIHIDGITHIQLDHVDELATALAMLPSAGKHRFEIMMPTGAAAELPTVPMTAPMPTGQQMLPDMPAPAPKARRAPSLAKIGTVYVTKTVAELMTLFQEHPEGLTTRQAVLIRHRDELMRFSDSQALEERIKLLVINFSKHMSAAQDDYGMIRKIKGSWLWTMSELGKLGNYEIEAKPSHKNRHNKAFNRYLSALKAGEVD